MQRRALRIQDPALKDAAARFEQWRSMLARRVDEAERASDPVARALALFEGEVAARLVESAAREISLRLLPHGIARDAEPELATLLAPLAAARDAYEAAHGPLARA